MGRNIGFQLGIAAILTIALSFVSFGMQQGHFVGFDKTVQNFIFEFRSDTNNYIFKGITLLGEIKLLILIALIIMTYILVSCKQRNNALIIFFSLSGTVLLQHVLKGMFQRPRPEIIHHLVEVSGYSFPSGHTMISTAFYGVLGVFAWNYLRSKSKSSWYIPITTILIIFSIGISRIYLGVHYPSDVLAGFLAGTIWAVFCLLLPRLFDKGVYSQKKETSNL